MLRCLRGGGIHQVFTCAVAYEGHAVCAGLRISFQALVVAAQFTAALTPHTLIQELQHHEIGLVVLSLIAMMKIGAAEILQIGHHQPQHATGLENTPAVLQERGHLFARDVLQEVGGVDQIGSSVLQRQAAKKIGALHGRAAAAGVIQVEPVGVSYINTAAGKIDIYPQDQAKDLCNVRRVIPAARLGKRIKDKGNLCHLPPNTWS